MANARHIRMPGALNGNGHFMYPTASPQQENSGMHAAAIKPGQADRQSAVQRAFLLRRDHRHSKKLPPELQKTAVQTAISRVEITPDQYHFSIHGIGSVEMRGVEPLSEGSLAGLSTGVVCDLKFPHPAAHRRAARVSSFMLRVSPQSLSVLVPRVNDGGNRTRGQSGPPSRH